MKDISMIDMGEVTRLTRIGKLAEAMALLQGHRVMSTEPDTRSTAPDIRTRSPRLVPPLDLMNFGKVRATLGKGLERLPDLHIAVTPGARFEERTFTNQFGSRAYKIYIPSSYTQQPMPLVVMLHGCTQSPDDFAAGTRMNELAEAQEFIVAYPAQPQSANAQKCWNWFNPEDQSREHGEPSLISGICGQIMREFSVDVDRVYVAGLSAGGAAAAIMASAYPDLFAAVGVHSGLPCGAARDLKSAFAAMKGAAIQPRKKSGVPIIVFHGDGDRTVHPINGDQIITQASPSDKLQISTTRAETPSGMGYTRTVQSNGHGLALLEQWTLHAAGHAWSGGSPNGSYTDPRGPDASREMVRFFFSHRMAHPDGAACGS